MDRHFFKFGPFTLHPSRRLLSRDGEPLKVSGRALDMLIALLETPGRFYSNEELLSLVWGATAVDEGSIRVHMSGLRKALGKSRGDAQCIVNVSGKGYSFVGDMQRIEPDEIILQPVISKRQLLPAPVAKVFGRAEVCLEVASELRASRFMTIVGPGGVGKTTVALSVANALEEEFQDGVVYVDLSAIADAEQVPTALMSALGAGAFTDDPMASINAELSRLNVLLVLDSCEHVIDMAASVAESTLRAGSRVHVLATSREPLNAEGEWLRRLQPLSGPAGTDAIDAASAITFPAVEMFVSRACANDRTFAISDENAGTIAQLCLRLDGIPLAIELAASRIEEFGLKGVADRIGDRFNLLSKGRRTALPRHRTLRQTLDWSYELLSVEEAVTLRRLALFQAPFSLGDAVAVLGGEAYAIEDLLGELTSKSMLSTVREEATSYRLLDMTREYARLKLSENGEYEQTELSHARHCLAVLKQAEAEWDNGLSPRWLWHFGRRVWDVRQAIEWALSSKDHAALGVQITAHSSVLYTSLGMVDQHRLELDRAIEANAKVDEPDPLMDARMYSALGNVLYQVQGHLKNDATRSAFANAVSASRKAGDRAFEVRSLSGLSASYIIRGRHPEALALENQLIDAGGETDHAVQRTLAHSTFFEGMMARARVHLQAALGTTLGAHDISSAGAQFDHKLVTLRSTLATYLFVTGRPESAMRVVSDCVDDVTSLNHPISLCHMLCGSGCPVSFSLGGRAGAAPLLDLLTATANVHSIGMWQVWAACFDAMMTPRVERDGTDKDKLLKGLAGKVDGTFVEFMSVLGADFVEPSFVDAALASPSKWCRPELVRVRAELDLAGGGSLAVAERLFEESLSSADAAGMVAWELRAATSLARLRANDGRVREGGDLLRRVMSKVPEGLAGNDFLEASTVLNLCSAMPS